MSYEVGIDDTDPLMENQGKENLDNTDEGIANPNYEEQGARPKEGGAYGGLDPTGLNRPTLAPYGKGAKITPEQLELNKRQRYGIYDPTATSTPKSKLPGELEKVRAKDNVNQTSTSQKVEEEAETDFGGTEKSKAKIEEMLESTRKGWEAIDEIFKDRKRHEPGFFAWEDEYGRVRVKGDWKKAKECTIINRDKTLNENFFARNENTKIREALHTKLTRDKVLKLNEEILSKRDNGLDVAESANARDQEELEIIQRDRQKAVEEGAPQSVIDEYDRHEEAVNTRMEERTLQIEQTEERMTLRDKIKRIFKKHGFTAFAVVSAVGVVIGVIVSNLAKGLGTVARGVGNALKGLGRKIGEILPGMVGAIASFIFRTAGQVLGFLGKNAWLLIMAVVLIVVEQFKRKSG